MKDNGESFDVHFIDIVTMVLIFLVIIGLMIYIIFNIDPLTNFKNRCEKCGGKVTCPALYPRCFAHCSLKNNEFLSIYDKFPKECK